MDDLDGILIVASLAGIPLAVLVLGALAWRKRRREARKEAEALVRRAGQRRPAPDFYLPSTAATMMRAPGSGSSTSSGD